MISIQHLCKKFDNKILLDDFNISISDGDFVVFCGESGCGKTTLLNMIGCLEKPDSGSIVIDGVDIWNTKKKSDLFSYKLGFLFQNFALLESKTVEQNLEIIQKRHEQIRPLRKRWKQLDYRTKWKPRFINYPVESSNDWLLQD